MLCRVTFIVDADTIAAAGLWAAAVAGEVARVGGNDAEVAAVREVQLVGVKEGIAP